MHVIKLNLLDQKKELMNVLLSYVNMRDMKLLFKECCCIHSALTIRLIKNMDAEDIFANFYMICKNMNTHSSDIKMYNTYVYYIECCIALYDKDLPKKYVKDLRTAITCAFKHKQIYVVTDLYNRFGKEHEDLFKNMIKEHYRDPDYYSLINAIMIQGIDITIRYHKFIEYQFNKVHEVA
jgi:hypothetical protein